MNKFRYLMMYLLKKALVPVLVFLVAWWFKKKFRALGGYLGALGVSSQPEELEPFEYFIDAHLPWSHGLAHVAVRK